MAKKNPERLKKFPTEYSLLIFPDEIGEYRWAVIHKNLNILADSGEGYKRKATMLKIVKRLFKHQLELKEMKIWEVKKSKDTGKLDNFAVEC